MGIAPEVAAFMAADECKKMETDFSRNDSEWPGRPARDAPLRSSAPPANKARRAPETGAGTPVGEVVIDQSVFERSGNRFA